MSGLILPSWQPSRRSARRNSCRTAMRKRTWQSCKRSLRPGNKAITWRRAAGRHDRGLPSPTTSWPGRVQRIWSNSALVELVELRLINVAWPAAHGPALCDPCLQYSGTVADVLNHPVSVSYDTKREMWTIANDDAEPMPEGLVFNVRIEPSAQVVKGANWKSRFAIES